MFYSASWLFTLQVLTPEKRSPAVPPLPVHHLPQSHPAGPPSRCLTALPAGIPILLPSTAMPMALLATVAMKTLELDALSQQLSAAPQDSPTTLISMLIVWHLLTPLADLPDTP